MRNRSIVALMLAFAFVPALIAADQAKWEVSRTEPPATVQELKALESAVKSMVAKVTPATLAVQYGMGAGSAVIVSEDGLVLTAAHVVTPQLINLSGGGRGQRNNNTSDMPWPKKCTLQLADGTRVSGVVLGRNGGLIGGMDSAMVKITDPVPKKADWPGAKEGKWPAVELGNSSDLKKGQWVVSLGHPGGPKEGRRAPVRLGQMVEVTKSGSRIRSDCTLVGGDSGGPLFDLDGKLLGIHSSIGLDLSSNFHVPTHAFQKDWKRLVRGDIINPMTATGWLGMTLAGDHERDADGKRQTYSRNKEKPVIESVTKGSPAEAAGLLANDLILEFKGEKTETSEDVDHMQNGMKPGETVLIKIRRGQDTYELEITLGKRTSN